MKKVYAAVIEGEMIAYHKEKKVMEKYLYLYKKSNPSPNVGMTKVARKAIPDLYYHEYYLVPWRDIVIQEIYVDTMEFIEPESRTDELVETLMELMGNDKLRKKEKEAVLSTLQILENNEKRRYSYIPSIKELKDGYWRLEEYRNKTFY